MSIKSCFTCGYRALNPLRCQIIGCEYAIDRNCPYWTEKLHNCGICNKIIVSATPIVINRNDSWIYICEDCLHLSGTCGGCLKSSTCDFETNPSPIPKTVQKHIQQGNMITLTTVKNDKRVAETCAKNCDCFNHEAQICCREFNTCGKCERKF